MSSKTSVAESSTANLGPYILPADDAPPDPADIVDDDFWVRCCLEDAIEFFHAKLPDAVRTWITEKWGINDDIIDNKQIGFNPGGNEVVDHLLNAGYDRQTILRAGIANCNALKHIYECNTSNDCYHDSLPDPLDVLADARSNGTITTSQIDLQAVIDRLVNSAYDLDLYNWWDDRVVFPYRNGDGQFSYLIGRATPSTTDKFYDDGFVSLDEADFDDGPSLINVDDTVAFSTPAIKVDSPGTNLTLTNHTDANVDVTATWEPKEGSTTFSMGALVADGHLSLTLDDYGTYLFEFTDQATGAVTAKLGVAVTKYDQYEKAVIPELRNEPTFEDDRAKYIKQPVNRPWVNRSVINEPLFGVSTARDGLPLVITEGITDAIMAHQHGIPCIAPATTQFKKEHYPEVARFAKEAGEVYVVNDSETTDSGINGALKTATYLRDEDVEAYVGELPLPDGREKIDLAEYLKANNKETLVTDVLSSAIPPREHSLFDPSEHEVNYIPEQNPNKAAHAPTVVDERRETGSSNVEAPDEDYVSDLYHLNLKDVVNDTGSPTAESRHAIDLARCEGDAGAIYRGQNPLYRGDNPIAHEGQSHSGYFVFFQEKVRNPDQDETWFRLRAHSFKNGGYNALLWLLCDAGVRSTEHPHGALTHEEVWEVWKHAKRADYVDLPDDDPIPTRALWHLADEHDAAPESIIPDSHEEDRSLPPSLYNDALDIVRDEYGLDPGRETRDVADDDSGRSSSSGSRSEPATAPTDEVPNLGE